MTAAGAEVAAAEAAAAEAAATVAAGQRAPVSYGYMVPVLAASWIVVHVVSYLVWLPVVTEAPHWQICAVMNPIGSQLNKLV